jgi:hypothetical protein
MSCDQVVLLFDNIDKGWPSQGANEQDIAILRCLLEASRKLQRQLETQNVDFKCLVFIRKDIFDLLVDQTPDRGKESVVNLDWTDEFLLKELVRKRFAELPDLSGTFDEIWRILFDPHVGGEDSFHYIMNRTFFQPREIINYVRKCVHVAISRGHTRVEEEDILIAEISYSEDMLNNLRYEMRDVFPEHPNLLNCFIRKPLILSKDDLTVIILDGGIPEDKVDITIDRLIWFSFLGVSLGEDRRFSYQVTYNIDKLKSYIMSDSDSAPVYCIHPAFHKSLEVT